MFTSKKMTAALFVSVFFSGTVIGAPVRADEVSDWMFEHLDANSDGQLTKTEFRGSYLDGDGEDWTLGLRPACTDAVLKAMDPQMDKMFKEMDLTKDGKIGRGEFATAGVSLYNEYWEESFKLADKDNNAKLSTDEFVEQISVHYDNLRKEYQADKIPSACQVDLAELYASDEEIFTAKDYFQFLDKNDDGALSQPEYMAQTNS